MAEEVKLIRLRMGHDDKTLGMEIGCSAQKVVAKLENGVLTLSAPPIVMGALGRFGRQMYRISKKPAKTPEEIVDGR